MVIVVMVVIVSMVGVIGNVYSIDSHTNWFLFHRNKVVILSIQYLVIGSAVM